MTQNRYYSSVAFPTYLTTSVGSSGNPQVAAITGLPSSYPFTMLIDWGLSTQEAISVTSAPTGSGPYTLPCTRGIDETTAQSHSQNAVVVHGVTAEDYNEPQVHISLAESGTGISAVHGLTNGSSVVGTTDTQTLTNKTFTGATVSGGDLNITNSDGTNPVLSITNTNTNPSASIVRIYAAASGNTSFGIRVTGDTVNRFHVDSNGKHQWGAGGSSALDTDFYREAAGVLQTDTALIVGTSLTAATAALSTSATAGGILVVTNTHSGPSAPSVQFVSASATDGVYGIEVSGDADYRYMINSSGKIQWSSGSASSDTNLYRNTVGELKTDESFTAAANLTVGGAQLLAGGSGVFGIVNAGTTPTSTPSGGAVGYAKSGFLKYRGADGLDYNTGDTRAYLTSPFTTANSGSVQNVTGLSLVLGAFTYELELWAPYVGAGTVGSTSAWAFTFGGTATTGTGLMGTFSTASFGSPTYTTSITNSFTSPTLTSTDTLFTLKGILVASAGGTLQLTITNTTNADETSVLAGAFLKASIIA
jgi:hypothetical protein